MADGFTVLHGDCRGVLCAFPDACIDAVVTDPPAGIAFMGAGWDTFRARPGCSPSGGRANGRVLEVRRAFVAFMTEVFREVCRVLKPGGHAVVWTIPRTAHWTTWALEDAGFEVRDRGALLHVFSRGFPKSMNLRRTIDDPRWAGFGTALKPAYEPWVLVRRPLAASTVAENVQQFGVGALNIDAARVAGPKASGGACGLWSHYRDGTEPRGRGAGEPSANRRYADRGGATFMLLPGPEGGDPAGRWPPNLVFAHDECCVQVGMGRVRVTASVSDLAPSPVADVVYGSRARVAWEAPGDVDGFEEVEIWACVPGCPVRALDDRAGPSSTTGRRSKRSREYPGNSDSVSRFFPTFHPLEDGPGFLYHGKVRKAERWAWCQTCRVALPSSGAAAHGGHELEHHPTQKPLGLCRWLLCLVTPPGGAVLDPFCGTGSIGVAAIQSGFRFVGIEQDEGYVEVARARIGVAGSVSLSADRLP